MTASGPKKMLLVNDNRHVILTLSQILLTNGYQLSYAESEAQAL
jgi:PleD family two-component response regulator